MGNDKNLPILTLVQNFWLFVTTAMMFTRLLCYYDIECFVKIRLMVT